MNHDINVKKMRLNCFRQSKVPGEFMLQMRVPGGMVDDQDADPIPIGKLLQLADHLIVAGVAVTVTHSLTDFL